MSAARGTSVVVVSSDGSFPPDVLHGLIERGWDAHAVRPAADARTLGSAFRKLNAGLVHFRSSHSGPAPLQAARALGAKVVMTVDGEQLVPGTSGRRDWEGIDVVHVPEPSLRPLLYDLGYPQEKAIVVIPPVAAEPFTAPRGRTAAAEPGLRILSVGALRWYSGYEYALEAVKILLDRGVRCRYRIVGEGDYAAALAFACDQLALDAVAEIVPAAGLETLRAHLAWADVYLAPGLVDGGSEAIVHAQSMGLPVVATSGRGLSRDLVEEGTGFVVPRRDPRVLAAKLELLSDQARRARLGEAARTLARDRFGVKSHVAQLDELYRQALAAAG